MRELPAAFLSSMSDILGEDYPLFAASQQEESVRGIRFSTLKADGSDIEEVLDLLGEEALPVPWCPAGYYTVGDSRPALLPTGLTLTQPTCMSATVCSHSGHTEVMR